MHGFCFSLGRRVEADRHTGREGTGRQTDLRGGPFSDMQHNAAHGHMRLRGSARHGHMTMESFDACDNVIGGGGIAGPAGWLAVCLLVAAVFLSAYWVSALSRGRQTINCKLQVASCELQVAGLGAWSPAGQLWALTTMLAIPCSPWSSAVSCIAQAAWPKGRAGVAGLSLALGRTGPLSVPHAGPVLAQHVPHLRVLKGGRHWRGWLTDSVPQMGRQSTRREGWRHWGGRQAGRLLEWAAGWWGRLALPCRDGGSYLGWPASHFCCNRPGERRTQAPHLVYLP